MRHRTEPRPLGGIDWAHLAQTYQPTIRRAVRRRLAAAGRSSEADVDDLVQEVYLRLLSGDGRRLRGFRGRTDAELRCWLIRVARRVVVDALRRESAKKRGSGFAARTELSEQVSDRMATPEERLIRGDAGRRLVGRFRDLLVGPRRDRDLEIARLAFVGGWTSREIAPRVGLAPSGVDSVLHRLRRRIRRAHRRRSGAGGLAKKARGPLCLR